MKKLLIITAMFIFSFLVASKPAYCSGTGEDLTKNSTFQKDTTIKSVTFKIYEGSKGGRFIIVTSKTGTQYKKYLKK